MKRSVLYLVLACAGALNAAPLMVGWATTSVTPDRPVALGGQMFTRISKFVHDPVTATALAMSSAAENSATEQVIMVSLDGPGRDGIVEALRDRLKSKLPDFDTRKLFLNATHTHTAPETDDGMYRVPEGIMRPSEYREFLLAQLTGVAVKAWQNRAPGGLSWALSQAVVGHNRRAVYANGKAAMYGKTNNETFRNIEGYEDHGVQLLFLWDQKRQLTGVVIGVACPSQEVEGESFVSADFWGDVRAELRKRHSAGLFVYPIAGPSGDQSPHLLFRRKAEERMQKLRGLSATQELGRRIANAVDDVLTYAAQDIRTDLPMAHKIETLQLPVRKVSAKEAEDARSEYNRAQANPSDPNSKFIMYFKKQVLDRFENQDAHPTYPAEVHALRLGDVAIATSPFELFIDYGVRIEARSAAEQTILIQLTDGYGGYLPTQKALDGGSYSALVDSNQVGAEGGQMLVDRTVQLINSMW